MILVNELYHHGILGQKWGKRNGPPYPLNASDHSSSEKKAGWRKSLASYDDVYAVNDQSKPKINSDGSQTFPKGYKFNRVGGEELRFNKAGGLYVSCDRLSASMYVNQLGPTPIAKLLKNAQTHVQNITATKSIKMASEDETVRLILEAVKEDRDYYEKIKESFLYTYAFDSDNGITDEAFERCITHPNSKEAKKMAYVFCSTFGNTAISDSVSKVYDKFRKNGFDAMPDIYDIYTGASSSPLIILNPNSIKMTDSHFITKEIMKDGRRYIKQYMKEHPDSVTISEILNEG